MRLFLDLLALVRARSADRARLAHGEPGAPSMKLTTSYTKKVAGQEEYVLGGMQHNQDVAHE